MRSYRVRADHAHFTWLHTTALTHNNLNSPQVLDEPLHRFLSAIFGQKLEQNTIIVLYSDHAVRDVPEILNTDSGFHEARLPLLYIYTPENVRLMNDAANGQEWLNAGELRQILARNAHALTSHMDIHATLRHILTGKPPSRSDDGERYGVSLFTPISPERTCADAGIPPELCLCTRYRPFKSGAVAEAIAEQIVRHINQNILGLSAIFHDRCRPHAFDRVTQAKMMDAQGRQLLLLLMFATRSGAEFQVNVRLPHQAIESGSAAVPIEIVGQIVRVDRYAEQSHCVADSLNRLVRFCVCK